MVSPTANRACLLGSAMMIAAAASIGGCAGVLWHMRARHQHVLRELGRAQTDPTTQLLTRQPWETAVGSFLHPSAEVGFLDMADFKAINDTYGHTVGDRVLAWTARRLATSLPTGSLATRWAGDEFAFVAPHTVPWRHLLEQLAEPVPISSTESLRPAAALGVVRVGALPERPPGLPDAIRAADVAMYHAKHAGTGVCHIA